MEILQEQLKARKAGISYAVLTVAESEGTSPCTVGKKLLLLEDGTTFGTVGGGDFERQAITDAVQALRDRRSYLKRYTFTPTHEDLGLGCRFKTTLWVEVVGPRVHLVVCGGEHVGGAALRLAKLLHFRTTLIDNRPPDLIGEEMDFADSFHSSETYEAGILAADIPDGAYYLCCASTHTQDKSALKGALQKKFAYVGMLGSAKKTVEMYRQLEEEGVSRDLLQQVYTPVGLDICNMVPEEVAFSVLSEILMVKNGGTGRSRRDRMASLPPKSL